MAASLQLKPAKYREAMMHPPNLPTKAVIMITKVNPQVTPSFSKPRSVESPDIVKYCNGVNPRQHQNIGMCTYERKEDDRGHILELLCQFNSETTFTRDDKACKKGAWLMKT